jgi:hypothetical protein
MKLSKKRTITLSLRGRNIESLGFGLKAAIPSPTPSPTPQFDWQNALVDGLIIAMITFFTTLGGVTATGANVTTILVSATISAVAQFFVLLAIKRGIRSPTTT